MYKTEQFDTKAYRITTDFDGQEISFNVVVANDESEIDELVECHLNYLRNPNQVTAQQQPSKSNDEIIQEQQAIITDLKSRIEALEQA
jgi:hypothetical protein